MKELEVFLKHNAYVSESDILGKVMHQTAEQTEKAILKGLEELVSRGLLVVHYDDQQLVREYDPTIPNGVKFAVRTAVRLELKDQGYIQKLELENKQMRELLEQMQALVGK
jgi:hypothetical protein